MLDQLIFTSSARSLAHTEVGQTANLVNKVNLIQCWCLMGTKVEQCAFRLVPFSESFTEHTLTAYHQ